MMLQKTYSVLLGLFPMDFQTQFGREMAAVFEQASAQSRRRGTLQHFFFAVREISGLLTAAARERIAHRHPARQSAHPVFPSDAAGAEGYIELVSRRVIAAIANHDFANARYYHEQDRKARALLAELRFRSDAR